MPYRDPCCVYVADNISDAKMTVLFLKGHDIDAKVIENRSMGAPLDLLAPSALNQGIEIWVYPSQVEDARRLLAEHAASKKARSDQAKDQGPVQVVCESCGTTTTFAGDLYGSIQDCPRCGAFVDVGTVEDWEFEETDTGNSDVESHGDDIGDGSR